MPAFEQEGFEPASDPGQRPLFDEDLVAPTRDTRSVGELLRDVDRQARDLLFEVRAEDAGPLIRGWPTLVQSAWNLWDAVPGRPTDPQGREKGDRPLLRTLTLSETVSQAVDRKLWPGQGPADRRIIDWATSLDRAAQLVRRYSNDIPSHETAAHRDISLARTRILHGLYVANHATMVALRERSRDLRRDPSAEIRPAAINASLGQNLVSSSENWISRLAATERTLSTHLAPRIGWAGPETQPQDSELEDPNRLERALTRWDLQAHRTLVRDPSPANVYLVCRAQVVVAALGSQLPDSGSYAGSSTSAGAWLAAGAAGSTQRAWSALADRWHDLVLPQHRLDPLLGAAAGELRTAVAGAGGAATPESHDADPVARVVGQALDAAVDLAELIRDLADNGALTGPAGPLSRRSHNDVDRKVELGSRPDADTLWVSPWAVMRKAVIPLPEPVMTGLRSAAADACSEARRAAVNSSQAPVTANEETARISAPVGPSRPEWGTGLSDKSEVGCTPKMTAAPPPRGLANAVFASTKGFYNPAEDTPPSATSAPGRLRDPAHP